MRIKLIGLLCVCMLCLVSCNKTEGEGGNGTIQGYVKLINHPEDNYALPADTMDASKTDVFIVYGNSDFYGDDVETDDKGFYQFKYLTEGNYTVFSYSTLPSGDKIPVSATVYLSKGGTTKVDDIYIHSGKAYGTSIVKGKVWAKYYKKDELVGSGWAYEHRVYIKHSGGDYHFDDVRVGYDGIFAFQKLQPGDYEVFTFTENSNEVPSPLLKTISVDEAGQIIEMVPDTTFVVRVQV